jgi:chromosome segregation ATPase
MTNTKDIIIKLKEVREEKGLSYGDILELMERNGDYLAKSTLSRVFGEGSEGSSFDYENTIRPIAKALLDIETIEDTDNMDVQAMKSLLKYKIQRIEELEKSLADLNAALDHEKVKYHEKLDKEREQHQKSIEFLKNQIDLKDKRMDQLLNAVFEKDNQHKELLELILSCPARQGKEC